MTEFRLKFSEDAARVGGLSKFKKAPYMRFSNQMLRRESAEPPADVGSLRSAALN